MLIRYADDEVICCPTRERAEAALAALRDLLGELGLELSSSKTRIVGVASGEYGYDFPRIPPSHGAIQAVSVSSLSGVLAE